MSTPISMTVSGRFAARSSRSADRWVALALLTVVIGCGDDDDADMPATGTAGRGGSSASSGGGSGSGSSTPQPVACGSTPCTVNNPFAAFADLAKMFNIPLPMPVACCLEDGTGQCGVAPSVGAACEPPAAADPRCPALEIRGFPGASTPPMPGCCIANQCGLDGAFLGRGCVDNAQAKSMIDAIGFGMFATLPPVQACDAPPPPVTTPDAGAMPEADGGESDAGI
jgi:hypothetical protein